MLRRPWFMSLALAAAAPALLARGEGEVFLTSRLEVGAGYENNRLAEFGIEEQSPFWAVSPALEVTSFGKTTETSLLCEWRRTQYTKGDLEFRDQSSLVAAWRKYSGHREAGLRLAASLYKDALLPTDDHVSWRLQPFLVQSAQARSVELSLDAAIGQAYYDASVYTSVTDRTDSRLEIRPGLTWHGNAILTARLELYGERNLSDAPEADYVGFGGAVSFEIHASPRLDVGARIGAGSRSYDNWPDIVTRRDTPTPVNAWLDYRLKSWLELFASFDWESNASTVSDYDYTWWQASAGLRLVLESEVGRH